MDVQESREIIRIIRRALAEDVRTGDVTSTCTLPEELRLRGRIIAKAPGVVAGLEVAQRVFALMDRRVRFAALAHDGIPVSRGTVLATVEGPGRSILGAERVALNFLQRMSGIATLTQRYVQAVRGTRAVILDTRKTAPGLRVLDKMAVRLGGGQNHRFGLFDMVLIKDNHIAAAGGIAASVRRVRACDGNALPIEVEVKNLDELREALALGVDRILLDNMDPAQLRQSVALAAGRAKLEASGGIHLDTIAAVAGSGVDFISVGALTHSAQALDISLDVEPV